MLFYRLKYSHWVQISLALSFFTRWCVLYGNFVLFFFNIFILSFQYQEDIQALNEVASRQPHSVFIANSRELREMQQENQRLQIALDEHRKALEYIMSKYRQHVQWQIWNSRIDFQGIINRRQQEVYFKLNRSFIISIVQSY